MVVPGIFGLVAALLDHSLDLVKILNLSIWQNVFICAPDVDVGGFEAKSHFVRAAASEAAVAFLSKILAKVCEAEHSEHDALASQVFADVLKSGELHQHLSMLF